MKLYLCFFVVFLKIADAKPKNSTTPKSIENSTLRFNHTTEPYDDTTEPTDETTEPIDDTTTPSDGTTATFNHTTARFNHTTAKFNGTTGNATHFNITTVITTTTIAPNIIQTTLFNRYFFEGVDYDILPEKLVEDYKNCYGQNIRCVRVRTDHYPVCGYNLWTGVYDDYYGPCEIELQNCYYRVKAGLGVYGTDYKNDIIFYNGEGYNCIYYMRRAKTKEEMHKLYMGDDYDDDYDVDE